MKTEIDKLIAKKERKLAQWERAKSNSLRVYNNLGWGAGMRRTKLVSFDKEDNIRYEIECIDALLTALNQTR